jgi:hypothetical protein
VGTENPREEKFVDEAEGRAQSDTAVFWSEHYCWRASDDGEGDCGRCKWKGAIHLLAPVSRIDSTSLLGCHGGTPDMMPGSPYP